MTNAELDVRRTYFDDCRHSVAANGDTENVSWDVQKCHQGPESKSHAFDTHTPGARRIVFKNNYSELTDKETVRIRGELAAGGIIEENWFENENQDNPGDENTAIRVSGESFENAGVAVRNNYHKNGKPPSSAFPWG